MKKKDFIFKAIICIFMLLMIYMSDNKVYASCSSGINNNGLGGININVNSNIYDDSRWKAYGDPYGTGGCTWFVGARVMELTGKGTYNTQVGSTWMNSYGTSLGFSTGQNIQAPAVICWSGHVAILEKIVGDTAYISEGGSLYYSDGAHGYTVIRTVNLSALKSLNSGFLGFVYLPSNPISHPVPDITGQTPSASSNVSGLMTIQFNAVSNASYYDIVLFDTDMNEIDYKNIGTSTTGTMQLPRMGVYHVKIYAYSYLGERTISQPVQVIWSSERIAAVNSGAIVTVRSSNGAYWYADTPNACLRKKTTIDYSQLNNYLFKFVKLNSDNEYAIYSIANGKAVTLSGGVYQNNALLSFSNYTGNATQKFIFKRPSSGTGYVIMLTGSRIAVDAGYKSDNLMRMYLFTNYENANQYFVFDETQKITGWHQMGNSWYYYVDGVAQTGWQYIDGSWYYLQQNGVMQSNSWMKDSKGWCYLEANGKMATNKWVKDSQGWCYVGADGYCVTNTWKQDSQGWCYLDTSGRMATNKWIKDSQGWCYVGADGYCVTNQWKRDSKGWCYLDGNGRMAMNKWIKDSQGWCYVGADGYCVTNTWKQDSQGWCYLDANGRMVTGWKLISGKWYYFHTSGTMAASQWVGNYYLQSDGTMATNKWIGKYYVGADGCWIP